METFENAAGDIMVRQDAGGHGGGITSSVVRPATDIEAAIFLQEKHRDLVFEPPAPEPEADVKDEDPAKLSRSNKRASE